MKYLVPVVGIALAMVVFVARNGRSAEPREHGPMIESSQNSLHPPLRRGGVGVKEEQTRPNPPVTALSNGEAPARPGSDPLLPFLKGPTDLYEFDAYEKAFRREGAPVVRGTIAGTGPFEIRLSRDGDVVLRVFVPGNTFTLWPEPGRYEIEVRLSGGGSSLPQSLNVTPGDSQDIHLSP